MSKPKNMTPEQLIEWKLRRNECERTKRHSDPNYRAKVYARNNKSLRKQRATNPKRQELDRVYGRAYAQRPDVKARNSKRMVALYNSNPEYADKVKKQHRHRYATDTEHQTNRKAYEKDRRVKRRLDDEFAAFIERSQELETCTQE